MCLVIESVKFMDWWSDFRSKKINGLTLPFVIIVRDKSDIRLVTHERIHHAQMIETLFLGYYLSYFFFYYYGLLEKKLTAYQAYCAIPYEAEAIDNDDFKEYPGHRPVWAFIHYFKYLRSK